MTTNIKERFHRQKLKKCALYVSILQTCSTRYPSLYSVTLGEGRGREEDWQRRGQKPHGLPPRESESEGKYSKFQKCKKCKFLLIDENVDKQHIDLSGEREFPDPVIPGNTSFKFPFPWHFVISLPVPGKRNFWTGIRTGNTIIACLQFWTFSNVLTIR